MSSRTMPNRIIRITEVRHTRLSTLFWRPANRVRMADFLDSSLNFGKFQVIFNESLTLYSLKHYSDPEIALYGP